MVIINQKRSVVICAIVVLFTMILMPLELPVGPGPLSETPTMAMNQSTGLSPQRLPKHPMLDRSAKIERLKQGNYSYHIPPSDKAGANAEIGIQPSMGQHRPSKDAVFCYARMSDLAVFVRFLGSLLETKDYNGDIVLGVPPRDELSKDSLSFLEYHATHSGVVVYEVPLDCKKISIRIRCQNHNLFKSRETNQFLQDPRPHREQAQLRFELYWAWSTMYDESARIFMLDARDMYFQANPFRGLSSDMQSTLMVFEETRRAPIGKQNSNSLWIRKSRGRDVLARLRRHPVLCSGTSVGGQPAVVSYTSAMVAAYDETHCVIYGCDQGHHNYLVHSGLLVNATINIDSVVQVELFQGNAISVGTFSLMNSLRSQGRIDNSTNQVINDDGTSAPIVHQYDRDFEMCNYLMGTKTWELFNKWKQKIGLNETFESKTCEN